MGSLRQKNRAFRALLLFVILISNGLSSARSAAANTGKSQIIEEDDPWAVTDLPERPEISEPLKQEDSTRESAPPPARIANLQLLKSAWQQVTWKQFTYEILLLAFCVVYVGNIIYGRQKNAELARAWGRAFCLPGGIFDRNFALVGTGDDRVRVPLIKESGSQFTLYCSGRRHCQFLKATLQLKRRQDLFIQLISLVFPWDDKVDIEVVMNEGSMPQIVLAVATKKVMKSMLKEESGEDDVRKLARKTEMAREKAQSWPTDKLVVYAEHSSIFNDIITEPIIDQLFSRAAFETHGKYFQLLHFTSEQSYGPKEHRAVLRFSFKLPAKNSMWDLSKLLSSVGAFIDIVGNYKLTPDMKKRAEKLRQDIEKHDAKDKEKERQDAAEERRLAKRAEEQDKLRRMTPEQREKYEQRRSKIESKRQQAKRVRRI